MSQCLMCEVPVSMGFKFPTEIPIVSNCDDCDFYVLNGKVPFKNPWFFAIFIRHRQRQRGLRHDLERGGGPGARLRPRRGAGGAAPRAEGRSDAGDGPRRNLRRWGESQG